MNTIQPSVDSPSYPFADWLGDAVALVQRVNARLTASAAARSAPALRPGRQVLSDQRCLELAALVEHSAVATP